MELMRAIGKRKSARSYKAQQLSGEILNGILAAGCAAPVGMGKYDSMHLTVIQDKTVLNQLGDGVSQVMSQMTNKEIKDAFDFYGAPTVVLISSNEQDTPGIEYTNAGCIAENMALAATSAKVGSCIVWAAGTAVEADTRLKSILEIPEGFSALFSVVLGYTEKETQSEKDLNITISINRI